MIFPGKYMPVPMLFVTATVCMNTHIPPTAIKKLHTIKRMASLLTLRKIIQPFDNSNKPQNMALIAMGVWYSQYLSRKAIRMRKRITSPDISATVLSAFSKSD